MEKRFLTIGDVPAILWGPSSDNLFIAVHGDQSHKTDDVMVIFAEEAVSKGYQVLGFDLPEHGERKEDSRLCKVQNCVEDLNKVMRYAHTLSNNVGLFGCSIGAYFSMLAYKDEQIEQALFLSPVVDMKRVIDDMMTWFDVSDERLEREQIVTTPVKTLYWDYYQYVLEHPVEWNKIPTALLYGARDDICEFDDVKNFAERNCAKMTIAESGEHFFHTEQQLVFLREWLHSSIAAK